MWGPWAARHWPCASRRTRSAISGPGVAFGRLSIQRSMSLESHPTALELICLRAGNTPSRSSRQIELRESPVRSVTSSVRRIRIIPGHPCCWVQHDIGEDTVGRTGTAARPESCNNWKSSACEARLRGRGFGSFTLAGPCTAAQGLRCVLIAFEIGPRGRGLFTDGWNMWASSLAMWSLTSCVFSFTPGLFLVW